MLYQFDGVISGTLGAGAEIFVTDYGIELGVTKVSYLFEVDFNRDVGGFSTSTQTVSYFYADLIGDSLAFLLLEGTSAEEYRGYNIDFVRSYNTGQLRAGNVITITTNENETPLWRVEDWTEGQSFRFNDGTIPPGGGAAQYLVGEVRLTSISPIPEATTSGLVSLAAAILLSRRRRLNAQSGPGE